MGKDTYSKVKKFLMYWTDCALHQVIADNATYFVEWARTDEKTATLFISFWLLDAIGIHSSTPAHWDTSMHAQVTTVIMCFRDKATITPKPESSPRSCCWFFSGGTQPRQSVWPPYEHFRCKNKNKKPCKGLLIKSSFFSKHQQKYDIVVPLLLKRLNVQTCMFSAAASEDLQLLNMTVISRHLNGEYKGTVA